MQQNKYNEKLDNKAIGIAKEVIFNSYAAFDVYFYIDDREFYDLFLANTTEKDIKILQVFITYAILSSENSQSEQYVEEYVNKITFFTEEQKKYVISKCKRYSRDYSRQNPSYNSRHYFLEKHFKDILDSQKKGIINNMSMFLNHFTAYQHWKYCGYINVLLKEGEWDENESTKLIENLKPSQIKFPYPIFTIDVSSYKWKYDNMIISNILVNTEFKKSYDSIELMFFSTDGNKLFTSMFHAFLNLTFKENLLIKENVNSSEYKEYIYFIGRIISICMYFEEFKNDKNRVFEKKQYLFTRKKLKASKNNTIIRKITLRQPEQNIERSSHAEHRKITHSFFVRGHWRNQSYVNQEKKERYNKLKWIDPYIKGDKSKMFRKVIEI